MTRIPLVFLTLTLWVVAASAANGQQRKAHKLQTKSTKRQLDPATVPAHSDPPLTPEQWPSSPPEVIFQSGELTIVARNSTMGDVLNAVKQKTGAAVEMPPLSSERVVGKFGPGAPRDVMGQLLNGSHYDYVLLGSPSDPGALKKVLLMARASGPEPVAPQQPANAIPGVGGDRNLEAIPEVENEQNPEENSMEVPAEGQQSEQEPAPEQQGQQNGPVVKTPEQLLRELQQQQQQQQQQPQQGVPPGAPGQPPQ